jgi:hypothetical protein
MVQHVPTSITAGMLLLLSWPLPPHTPFCVRGSLYARAHTSHCHSLTSLFVYFIASSHSIFYMSCCHPSRISLLLFLHSNATFLTSHCHSSHPIAALLFLIVILHHQPYHQLHLYHLHCSLSLTYNPLL